MAQVFTLPLVLLFPAGAGVIPSGKPVFSFFRTVPRRGGGDPSLYAWSSTISHCSPQGRG